MKLKQRGRDNNNAFILTEKKKKKKRKNKSHLSLMRQRLFYPSSSFLILDVYKRKINNNFFKETLSARNST